MIHLEIIIGEWISNTLFYVINVKTSYNVLIERPWLYENGVIFFTLHKCFMFYKGKEKKVKDDIKSFTEVKSYFVDAKFYIGSSTIWEVLPKTIPFTWNVTLKKVK